MGAVMISPDWQSDDGSIQLYCGDCLEIMPMLPDGAVDAVVTDPPYGLKFMGKEWDHGVPGVPFWSAMLRIAKPGAHLLAFGGTRTHHRLMCAIEDAGWEIRDTIGWLYGSGFPKSLDVSKAIDRAAGVEREQLGINRMISRRDGRCGESMSRQQGQTGAITAPATDDARKWEGWGTALKPAWEPIIVARKPLIGTVAANVLEYGTGAINIDGCRVGTNERGKRKHKGKVYEGVADGYKRPNKSNYTHKTDWAMIPSGRFPANIIHDGSDEVEAVFPRSKSCTAPSKARPESKYRPGQGNYQSQGVIYPGDDGSASRFFYCAKASKSERSANGKVDNKHPTVKPISLMRYLVRLVTPPGGLVLDPFTGSGSTGVAAIEEGMRFIGIEKERKYFDIAVGRIEGALKDRKSLLPMMEGVE